MSLRDYLRFQGNLNEYDPSLQGRLEGYPRGVPNVPLNSSATGTCRAGTSAHSVNLVRVPVELQVLYVKSCFFAVHPPHNLGRGYVGVSRVFSGRVLGSEIIWAYR